MADKKEKPKGPLGHGGIDDILRHDTLSIDDAIKQVEAIDTDENRNHYFNNIFAPAEDKLYQSIEKSLKKIGKDEDKLFGKKEDIQKIMVEGLKEYFKAGKRDVTKGLEGLSTEEQYQRLTQEYDLIHGWSPNRGEPKLQQIAEGFAKDKKATVGHLKAHIKQSGIRNANQAAHYHINKAVSNIINRTHRGDWQEHIEKKVLKGKFNIDDKVAFMSQDEHGFYRIYKGVTQGDWGTDQRGNAQTAENYGLAKYEPPKEK